MKLKVWYLDDEPELCETFLDDFSAPDISITVFSHAQEMIQVSKKSPPDLLFIDYRLHYKTGDEVAQLLDPKIPKVLITGDIDIATHYHFIKIISKPYKVNEISQLLEAYKAKV